MVYCIYFDWAEEFENNFDDWENLGRRALEDVCNHKTQDKGNNPYTNLEYSGYCEECAVFEDDAQPIYNYGYPLEFAPEEEQILSVVKETGLTVMYNNATDSYYLVLCGCGMDLSQSIAYAYILCHERIPIELLKEVCRQPCLSLNREQFEKLRYKIIGQAEKEINFLNNLRADWGSIPKEE